jgi:predicted dehydrogenase
MTGRRLRTVMIGFGKVGASYAEDAVMARYFPYATHAQVLAAHPEFSWDAVVDPAAAALDRARRQWRVPVAAGRLEELDEHYQPEIAVIATPPETRLAIVDKLPSLRGVLVEKPLGVTVAAARDFCDYCDRRGLLVQVNLCRRADELFRDLAAGGLTAAIGSLQAIFGIYGNGLLNNGVHMVDFVRLLCGEISAVQTMSGAVSYAESPIPDDLNLPFMLRLESGLAAMMHPVRFAYYRENSLDLWGEKGRLSIMQEGLGITLYPRRDNRAMLGEREIASDQGQLLTSTVGTAFYNMYSNLAAAVRTGQPLWSPKESALQTTRVIDAVLASARGQGKLMEL